jgi:inosine/xanthosine triphosphate pyrophosphatase family protein
LKKIVILNRHGEKNGDLENLLKTLFPECEISRVSDIEIEEDGTSFFHEIPLKARRDNEKKTGESS